MTEEEAKTKWCPFVRYVNGEVEDNAPSNRWSGPSIKEPTRCIASACMAWRRDPKAQRDMREVARKEYPGFCGLAGQP